MKMDLSEGIIGAAIAVHRELGPGFLEFVYENALVIELQSIGLKVEQQKEFAIYYQQRQIGLHRLDLLVNDHFIIELKTVETLAAIHFATVRSYLKATNLSDALILNFATSPLTIKRVGKTREMNPPPDFHSQK